MVSAHHSIDTQCSPYRYNGVHDELLDASHEEYKLYQEQLHLTRSHLDNIITDTTAALDTLSSLTASFQQVDAQTTAFRTQCEGLIEDQKRITTLADNMGQNLRYYLYLEPMTKRLNAPGAANIVRGKEFTDMLANLDSCLDYMQAHPNHRESQTYRSRYRLLLTRALTLIRVYFTNALREIAADVSKRIADRQLNDTTSSALLYAKFRVGAPELKAMGLEIQKRAVVPVDAEPGAEAEYQSLMNEMYQSYSATRGRLILPMVAKKIGEIAQAPSSATDLVAFARSSISYMRRICSDEAELWREWFEGERGMYDYLESMCEPLYDHLRPRTIHETRILKLCELCTFIQTQYMEEEDEDESLVEAPKLDFQTLVFPALQDAQNRLVFLSLAILRDDIERFKPQPEDLNYPIKSKKQALSGSKSSQPALSGKKAPKSELPLTPQLPKTPTIVEEDDPDVSKWSFNTEAAFKDWYPTLRKAIWLLSKIYRLVHVSVRSNAHSYIAYTFSRPYSMILRIASSTALLSPSVRPQFSLPSLLLPLTRPFSSYPICSFSSSKLSPLTLNSSLLRLTFNMTSLASLTLSGSSALEALSSIRVNSWAYSSLKLSRTCSTPRLKWIPFCARPLPTLPPSSYCVSQSLSRLKMGPLCLRSHQRRQRPAPQRFGRMSSTRLHSCAASSRSTSPITARARCW